MFEYYGLFGLTLMVLVFLLNFLNLLPYNAYTTSFNHIVLIIGVWLLFDALDFKLNGYSLLHRIKNKHKLLIQLILGGVFIGLFIEFFGVFVFELWGDVFYAYLSKKPFFQAILIFFSTDILYYILIFPACFSVYRVTYYFIKKEFKQIKIKHNFKRYENIIFPYLGLAGMVLTISSLTVIFVSNVKPLIKGLIFCFPLIGLWFFLEYLEYRHHQSSILKDIFEFKFRPLIGILITSFLIALIVEGLNFYYTGWSYKNLPLGNIKLLGTPIVAYVGWIPFVIIYLSFFRTFFKEKATNQDF